MKLLLQIEGHIVKSCLDCIPCFFHQALRAGRAATNDDRRVKQLLDQLGTMLPSIDLQNTPPQTGQLIYRAVKEVTGNPDPFSELKHESTQQALALYPHLKKTIADSEDPLLTAVRIAIAGNVMDYGASAEFDAQETVKTVLEQDFAICDYSLFREQLSEAKEILYVGDNAGETVFDRLLIEQMHKPVTYVVRDAPVINDATKDDAIEAGLDEVATIVSTGSDAPGAILSSCSAEFKQLLDRSTFTIAKGQGNYEGLSGEPYEVFFLFMAKCRVIAEDIGVAKGSIILKAGRAESD